MKLRLASSLLVASLAGAVFADGPHEGDIFLGVQNFRIVTGTLDNGVPEWNVHVFGMELGEDLNDPFYSEEPGFDNFAGTFTAPSSVGFNFARSIAKWNGSGFVDVANTMTATKAIGSDTLTATSGSGWAPGIMLPVEANGEWHEHYGWTLNGIGGADPEVGVYRLALRMVSDDSSLTASNEFWVIVNNGDSEENHDAAIDYSYEAVPEPATMLALGSGFAALLARRRRKQ